MVFPTFWRMGYAKEGCRRVIDLMFEECQVTVIAALIDTRNVPSIRLIESLGFSRVGTVEGADFFKGADSDEYQYEYKR